MCQIPRMRARELMAFLPGWALDALHILSIWFTLRFREFGEVSEWSKEHAWKVCVRHKRTEGSNPSLSANLQPNWPLPQHRNRLL